MYRAPEVILLEKEYDARASDVWSLGCCLAELLHCSKAKIERVIKDKGEEVVEKYLKLRYPFLGDSCYPLSPRQADEDDKDEVVTLSKKD